MSDNVVVFPTKSDASSKRMSLPDIQEILTQYLEAIEAAIENGEDGFILESPDGEVIEITPDTLVVMFSDGRNIAQDGLGTLNAMELLALREGILDVLEEVPDPL